jgi:hypothetical protein
VVLCGGHFSLANRCLLIRGKKTRKVQAKEGEPSTSNVDDSHHNYRRRWYLWPCPVFVGSCSISVEEFVEWRRPKFWCAECTINRDTSKFSFRRLPGTSYFGSRKLYSRVSICSRKCVGCGKQRWTVSKLFRSERAVFLRLQLCGPDEWIDRVDLESVPGFQRAG